MIDVTYFRPRRPGPEVEVQDVVVAHLSDLFLTENWPYWAAGSLPIGAGLPDLLIVSCNPRVFALARVEMPSHHILGYLRAVGGARVETIADRLRERRANVMRCLDDLLAVEAVSREDDSFCLTPAWRDVLPQIDTIEVKVRDWRDAVNQAGRNRVFAHRSYVALPDGVAQRVKNEDIFGQLGIGLLAATEEDEVRVLRRARRHGPRVWSYYYQLASLAAAHLQGKGRDAFCCAY